MSPRNRNIIIAVVAVVLVGFLGVRAYAPKMVAQNFTEDIYHVHFDDALQLVCPSDRAKVQQSFDLAQGILGGLHVSVDTSKLSYTVSNESLNTAHVTVGGDVSALGGSTQSLVQSVDLQANGLWWCVSENNGSAGG
jgi:hypothetical protein